MFLAGSETGKSYKNKKADTFRYLLFQNLAPLTGLEPVTYGLTVRRSTD